jgi:hypothetical protein
MAINVWQLGEKPDEIPPPWRHVLQYSGQQIDLTMTEEHKRRMSLGNLEDEEIDGIVKVVEAKK